MRIFLSFLAIFLFCTHNYCQESAPKNISDDQDPVIRKVVILKNGDSLYFKSFKLKKKDIIIEKSNGSGKLKIPKTDIEKLSYLKEEKDINGNSSFYETLAQRFVKTKYQTILTLEYGRKAVILKNGDTLYYKRLRFKSKDIIVEKSNGSEELTISKNDIEKLSYLKEKKDINGKSALFENMAWRYVKTKSGTSLMREFVDGYCSLYFTQTKWTDNTGTYHFYVKKKDEENATDIHGKNVSAKKYKKAGAKYFEDCPELVKMIANGEKANTSKELIPLLSKYVAFYNDECGER